MKSPALRYAKSLWSYNPIPYGCVLYLPLWSPGLNGSTFKSVDPFGHTCTVIGATQAANGRSFDGADDYIKCGSSTALLSPTAGTIEGWVKGAAHMCTASDKDSLNTDKLYASIHGISDFAYIHFEIGNVVKYNLRTADSTFDHTVWNHLVFTSDGSTIVCYINSVATALTVSLGSNNGDWFGDNTSFDNLELGALWQTDGHSGDFSGTIGEFREYNRALSQEEVTYSYNTTRGRYQ